MVRDLAIEQFVEISGYGSMVELLLSKQKVRVRFPLPAHETVIPTIVVGGC